MGKDKKKKWTEEPVKKSIFGNFSDPSFLSADDPYQKEEEISSRYLGASMKIAVPKKGHTADVYFEKKFHTLASSTQGPTLKGGPDVFMDPGKRDRLAAASAKTKNIDSKDFKYSHPGKAPTGAGSIVGLFQKAPFKHMEEYAVLEKGKAPPRPTPQPPNIKTSVPKKGTYGVVGAGITFSKIAPPPKDVHDEYEKIRELERKAWAASKEKIAKISQATFKSTARVISTFDEKNPRGVSSVYDAYTPPEDKKKKAKKAKKPEAPKFTLGPFIPAHGPKSGESGFFAKFANRRGDEPDPAAAPPKKGKEAKKKEEPKPLGGAWKPVSNPKIGVVRSLLRRFY